MVEICRDRRKGEERFGDEDRGIKTEKLIDRCSKNNAGEKEKERGKK